LTHSNKRVKLRIQNATTEEFNTNSGVKQGDPLSATLFTLVMDMILKQLDFKGNISTRLKQCCAYADDVLIIARTKQVMIDTFCKLKRLSLEYSLITNNQKTKYLKTKYLHCTRKTKQMQNLNFDNCVIEQVNSFKYLGSSININNAIEQEINERIVSGNKAYYAHQSLFKSKLVSKKAKWRLYQTIICPIVTYTCETWTLKEIKCKLQVFKRKILRRIYGPTKNRDGNWRMKTNDELNQLTKNNNIINYIKARRISWMGHVMRMEDNRQVKAIYKRKPCARRLRGRPKM